MGQAPAQGLSLVPQASPAFRDFMLVASRHGNCGRRKAGLPASPPHTPPEPVVKHQHTTVSPDGGEGRAHRKAASSSEAGETLADGSVRMISVKQRQRQDRAPGSWGFGPPSRPWVDSTAPSAPIRTAVHTRRAASRDPGVSQVPALHRSAVCTGVSHSH